MPLQSRCTLRCGCTPYAAGAPYAAGVRGPRALQCWGKVNSPIPEVQRVRQVQPTLRPTRASRTIEGTVKRCSALRTQPYVPKPKLCMVKGFFSTPLCDVGAANAAGVRGRRGPRALLHRRVRGRLQQERRQAGCMQNARAHCQLLDTPFPVSTFGRASTNLRCATERDLLLHQRVRGRLLEQRRQAGSTSLRQNLDSSLFVLEQDLQYRSTLQLRLNVLGDETNIHVDRCPEGGAQSPPQRATIRRDFHSTFKRVAVTLSVGTRIS